MKTTVYTLIIESSDKGTSAQSFLTEEGRVEAFNRWMLKMDPEEAEKVLALPSEDRQEAVDEFLYNIGGLGGDYVTMAEEDIEIPAPPKLLTLARMLARLTITGDDGTDSLDAASVRVLKALAEEALSEEGQPDPTPMETLSEVASSREIGHLMEQLLITTAHLTMKPDSIRRDEKETQIYFPDGLVVSLRDAVEPSTWWKD